MAFHLCPRSAGNWQQDRCMRCVRHAELSDFAAGSRQFAGKRAPTPSAESKAELQAVPAFDLHTEKVQTPQNATWVQAKRRRRAVGRAAWMPRERRQDMDARSARAHGALSECGYPRNEGPTRSWALLVTFGAFSKVTRRRGGKVIWRRSRKWICLPSQCQTPRTHDPDFDRSHAPRGNAATDALRQRGRGASWQAFPRRAWERS